MPPCHGGGRAGSSPVIPAIVLNGFVWAKNKELRTTPSPVSRSVWDSPTLDFVVSIEANSGIHMGQIVGSVMGPIIHAKVGVRTTIKVRIATT